MLSMEKKPSANPREEERGQFYKEEPPRSGASRRSPRESASERRLGGILKTLIFMSIPTIAEEVLATLLQYVDTAMVGHLGERATAAVSVTATVTWLVNSVPSSVGIGALALISKAYGARDSALMKRLSQQVFLMTGVCGVLIGGVSMALSPFIPIWMGAEAEIQREAARYFFIISAPMLFRSASAIFGAAIRATKDTRTPMTVNLAANAVNAGLNYLLIYVLGLGVTGAALASAVSYTLAGLLMFVVYRRSAYLGWRFKEWRADKGLIAECARVSLPVLGTGVVSCFGYVVFARLVAGMGTTVFAAHSIAVTAETIFYIPGYGLRTATSALVGIARGEGDRQKLSDISRLSVFVTMGMMVASGVILFWVAYPLMRLMTNSPNAAALGARMLRLVAFSEPFFGLMIVGEGILYGLGRTKYAFVIESLGMWGVRIFMTFLCINLWNADLRGVWYCMIADNVFKAVMLILPLAIGSRRRLLYAEAVKKEDV
ncbi:MAG: MATE family efflux transporter [Butyrivibrio sp.]|nr:MATE family efflux transporter [Butyrivibrio sp.]